MSRVEYSEIPGFTNADPRIDSGGQTQATCMASPSLGWMQDELWD